MSAKKHIYNWFSRFFQSFGKHLLSIVFVSIIFIVFRLPQINDLVLIMIQDKNDFKIMLGFYALIIIFAFLIANLHLLLKPNNRTKKIRFQEGFWQIVRTLLYNLNPEDEKEQYLNVESDNSGVIPPSQLEVLFPKLLATIFILSVAFAVDTAYYEFYGDNILPKDNWAFLILAVIMILATSNWVAKVVQSISNETINKTVPIVVAAICFFSIFILGTMNEGGRPEDFKRLFYSILALALLFYTLSVSYHPWLLYLKRKYGLIFGLLLITAKLILYGILFWNPELDLGSPLNIILVCLGSLYMVFMGLRIAGSYSGWPVFPIIFIGAIISTVFVAKSETFTHYEIKKVKSDIDVANRISLDEYADRWIENRLAAINLRDSITRYPIVLVSSEGGGSRAGHWSLLVQSYLYKNNPNYFHKHLFSLTGASGGSVGNNLFHTVAYENRVKKDPTIFNSTDTTFDYQASRFYSHDYISASIAALLGNDLLASIITWGPSKDRGNLLDEQWEKSFKCYFGFDGLSRAFVKPAIENEEFVPPLLVTNTTKVHNGKLNLMSNVSFEKAPTTENQPTSFQFEDLLCLIQEKHIDSTIKQSTAMRLNASFPYISPNARIKEVGQFGDSGYYDNVGGVVTRRLEEALLSALKRANLTAKEVEIVHLILTNNPNLEEMCCNLKPKEKDSISFASQLISPAKMVIQATFAHPNDFIDAAPDSFKIESKRTKITPSKRKMFFELYAQDMTEYCPIIPLGRYLSKDALRSLEQRLKEDEVATRLNALLKKMDSI